MSTPILADVHATTTTTPSFCLVAAESSGWSFRIPGYQLVQGSEELIPLWTDERSVRATVKWDQDRQFTEAEPTPKVRLPSDADTMEWLALAQHSFEFWDNEQDAQYDAL